MSSREGQKGQGDRYQPIENYGIIGDLRTIALVGLNGSIDFMCFPDFNSPSIFGKMLDSEKGGSFEITPIGESAKNKQMYLPSTNVLMTRFLFSQGIGELVDFMPVSENSSENVLVRRIASVKGEIAFRMRCAPRFDYGRARHKAILRGKELFFESQEKSPLVLKLTSSIPLKIKDGDGFAEFTLKPDETAEFVFEIHSGNAKEKRDAIKAWTDEELEATITYWKTWVSKSNYHGRWREMVDRSALLLKLLMSSKYGSMVAAPTFGLPEEIGSDKNWDYRYIWIRDASFTIYALMLLGYKSEAEGFMKWLSGVCQDIGSGDTLRIMYGIDGGTDLKEEILGDFEGYRGSRPVRIGNGAYQQRQLDIYGELMDSIYIYDKFIEPVSHDTWKFIVGQIDWVCKNWHLRGHGIWEMRGKKHEFLYSRFMCWVGVDRAIRLATRRSLPYPAHWHKVRDAIYHSVFRDFWNEERQTFVQTKGGSAVDAAVLMMPLVRFISPTDPRWLSTLKCIEEDLVVDTLVYRYKTKGIDGQDCAEGTFSLCSFLYIECLSKAGQLRKARFNFEKMLSYANHLGLYSEELGFQGEHLGNFPQAFTHLALISAAFDLDKRL